MVWHPGKIFRFWAVVVKHTKGENNLFYIVFINVYTGKTTIYILNCYLTETFDSLHFINFNLKPVHKYYSGIFRLIH